jgi:hypothetical protein
VVGAVADGEYLKRVGATIVGGTPAGGGSCTPDAADVTYTPAVLGDWDAGVDPGNVDGALDQLADRVADIEGAGVPLFAPSATFIIQTATDTPYDLSDSTPYTGAINGAPTNNGDGTYTVTFTAGTNPASMTGGMVLRNTTRNTKAMIVQGTVNKTAKTLKVQNFTPGDVAGWQSGDTITTKSATNLGRSNQFVDIDVTAWCANIGVAAIFFVGVWQTSGTASSAFVIFHPWETYAESLETGKLQVDPRTGFIQYQTFLMKARWEGSRAYITLWFSKNATTQTRINLQYVGQI